MFALVGMVDSGEKTFSLKHKGITCSDLNWLEKIPGLILLISHVIVVCKRVGTDGKLPFQ